jgi:hypothetical protein
MKVVTLTRISTHTRSCWIPSIDQTEYPNDAGSSCTTALANLILSEPEVFEIEYPQFELSAVPNCTGAHRARLTTDTPRGAIRGESEYDAIGRYVMENPSRFNIAQIVIQQR